MADDVKKVQIDIIAKTTKATDEIKKLNKQIDSLNKQQSKSNKSMARNTKSITRMGASFKTLGQHLSRLLVIYGSYQAITGTVKTFAEFEQSITNLGVISGATSDELESLKKKAIDLGESTVFTASQVAEAMTEMARAGLSASETLAGIDAVLNLSINGLMSLGESTKIVTSTMNAYGLEASDMAEITDKLSKAINTSQLTLDELGQALSKVGAVAHTQNISLTETISLLGVLADNGKRGAEAGTQLKIVMLRLGANPRSTKYLDKLNKLTKNLDVNMFKANGTLKPFIKRLDILGKALSSLNGEQATKLATRIFGSEAFASGDILMHNLKAIREEMYKVNHSFGYADENARTMMNTLSGSYKELLSALQTLQIRIGKSLSPALKEMVEDATNFVRSISPEDIDKFSQSIAQLVKFLGEVGSVFGKLIDISIKTGNAMSDSFGGINAELVLILAGVYKFRTALLELVVTNPVLFAIGASITAISLAIDKAQRQLKTWDTEIGRTSYNLKKMNDNMSEARSAIANKNLQKIRKSLKDIGDNAELSASQISKIKARMKELQPADWKKTYFNAQMTKNEKNEYNALKEVLAQYNKGLDLQAQYKKKLLEEGQKLIDQANAKRQLDDKLTVNAKTLSEAQIKSVNVQITAQKRRIVVTENTLSTLYGREKRYVDSIVKLEADLAKTRQKFADKRINSNANFENDVANIRASSLSKLQQYNDAQRRADVALSQARQALANGDLTVAKNYFSQYNSLITKETGSEIKQGKTVVKTKIALNNELIRDKTAGHKFEIALINEEERRAIASINNKIKVKKSELKLTELQINLQIKALDIQNKMLEKLTGVLNKGFDEDLKKAKVQVNNLSKELDKNLNKQRDLKLNVRVDKNKLNDALNNTPVTPKIDTTAVGEQVSKGLDKGHFTIKSFDIDTGKLISSYDSAIKKVTSKPATVIVEADTKKADRSILTSRKKAELPSKSLHSIKVNNRAVERAKLINSHNTSSTHTIYVRTVGKHAIGGFIQRQGALSGYGGGDKVKALLEQGEYIVRKEAVKSLGLDRLNQINQGLIPKFATGGLISTSLQNNQNNGNIVNVNLNVGNKQFQMQSDEQVANALADYLNRAEF